MLMDRAKTVIVANADTGIRAVYEVVVISKPLFIPIQDNLAVYSASTFDYTHRV